MTGNAADRTASSAEKHGPLGIHLGVGQRYDEAVMVARELGITCCQVFTHNPRGWSFAELDVAAVKKFREDLRTAGVATVASHCNYLINLGSRDSEIREKSIACFKKEFEYAAAFGCEFFVLHVGKRKEATIEEGIAAVAEGINAAKREILESGVTLLLETVAGQGSEIGRDFAELGRVIAAVDPELQPRIGVCLDTCHIFQAGYDIRTPEAVEATIQAMEKGFGMSRLRFIHLNDAMKELGSHVDRHQHIGEGFIGAAGFRAFLNHPRIAPVPKILETPVDESRGYLENLKVVRKLQAP